MTELSDHYYLKQWTTCIDMCLQQNGHHAEHIIQIEMVFGIKMFIIPMYRNIRDTLYIDTCVCVCMYVYIVNDPTKPHYIEFICEC